MRRFVSCLSMVGILLLVMALVVNSYNFSGYPRQVPPITSVCGKVLPTPPESRNGSGNTIPLGAPSSVEEASAKAKFQILFPTCLPEGYSLQAVRIFTRAGDEGVDVDLIYAPHPIPDKARSDIVWQGAIIISSFLRCQHLISQTPPRT